MARSRLRIRPQRPALCIEQILAWADDSFAAHRRWPNVNSGHIPGTIDDTWRRIDDSLRQGYCGLSERPRLSLAKLLEKRRGVRNSEYPPRLSIARIVQWAKRHRRRTGQWPTGKSGPIDGTVGETWLAIDTAPAAGRRGLPGGSSLALLLDAKRPNWLGRQKAAAESSSG
ncbi:MAG TPA: hypothetical protein VMP01_00255 [Pirellulaceae bacterium]|nr:hypothetical protein [Pirellulaceae bacterium]